MSYLDFLSDFGSKGKAVLDAPALGAILKDRIIVKAKVSTVNPKDQVIGILYKSINNIFTPMKTNTIANP
jgi:hypothetical protein